MIAQIIKSWITFHTNFNSEYKMLHSFTNFVPTSSLLNCEFDFLNSKLVSLDGDPSKTINLSDSSDAVPALSINGYYIGANHGQPSCVNVYSPDHKKTLKDVGAIYLDEAGVKFTLVRVLNRDHLTFISENQGESVYHYAFKLNIDGNLTYLSDGADTSTIQVLEQTERVFLMRSIKHHYKDIVVYKDGKAKRIIAGSCECDYAELQESYDIINPATVAPDLTKKRPSGGYTHEPDLSYYGESMINLTQVFKIMPNGTILIDFEITKLQPVRTGPNMAIMYQEMNDVYGGGIHRTLPKIKPFTTPEGDFDYSTPKPLRNAEYPKNFTPTKEYDLTPDKPFDRMVDYFRDKNGEDKMGFACGFLPVFDGAPEIRKEHLGGRIFLWHTRKAYPYFTSGSLEHYRGVGYKHFFLPGDRASVYSIIHEGKRYIYFDFFKENTLSYEVSGEVTPFELYNANYTIENGKITVTSNKGFAVFIENIE